MHKPEYNPVWVNLWAKYAFSKSNAAKNDTTIITLILNKFTTTEMLIS